MSLSLQPAYDPVEFNRVVAAQRYSSPLQAWAFGEAARTLGHEPVRYFIRRAGATVGAVQLVRKKMGLGVTRLYAPRGPALGDLALLPDLSDPLRAVARASDAYLKIEPPAPVRAESGPVDSTGGSDAGGDDIPSAYGPFQRAEAEQPEHTIIADLTKSHDDLFAGLHKMARRNIRAATRMGVRAQRDKDFEAFWHLFSETNKRARLRSAPRVYYETLFREGNKHGSETYLVLSRHEGQALAGGFLLGLGESTLYLYGGSVRDDRPPAEGQDKRKDAKAPDAFYWNAMVDAKEHGYSVFDFWGIPRVLDESKHSFGVFKMKLKFSTDRYWFPAYDLRLSPVATPVVKALHARRKLLNYRSRGTTDDIL